MPTSNEIHSSRSTSPRRLIKQVALESPPPAVEGTDFNSRIFEHEKKTKSKDQIRILRDKARKIGTTPSDVTFTRYMNSW